MEDGGRADALRRAVPERSALPPGFICIPRSSNDNWLGDPEPGPASELDCLRHVLAPALLSAAEARGREVGTGADQALIRSGVIDEDAYLQTLSFQTGLAIETFAEEVSRSDCSLSDRYLSRAAQHGLLPLRQRGQLVWVVAPRGFTARRLCRLAAAYPSLCDRVLLTSRRNLHQFLLRQEAGDVLGGSAANALGRRFPTCPPRRRLPTTLPAGAGGAQCDVLLRSSS